MFCESALKDRVAIVTGGNGGIGKEIATLFVQAGAHVAIFATNEEKGKATAAELQSIAKQGAKVHFYKTDVSNKESVDLAVAEVLKEMGAIHILVNNAGITRDTLLMKMSEKDWDDVINTNLKSIYNTSQAVIRDMLKARYGRIINISSVVALLGNAGQTNYSASKAGMIGFTKSLAREVATRNICVNCIAPGFIETNMTEALSEEQIQRLKTQIPMGKMGSSIDVAYAALFLATEASKYMTGQVISVDGGMHM